jgi:hypothetical protein
MTAIRGIKPLHPIYLNYVGAILINRNKGNIFQMKNMYFVNRKLFYASGLCGL